MDDRTTTAPAPGDDHATWTRVALSPDARPLDLMTARFRHQRYAPHAHEEFAIGVCVDGLEAIAYRGAQHLAGPGGLVVLEPGESHTGGAAGPQGYAYRVLYPSAALVGEGLAGGGVPHFPEAVVRDPALAHALARAHRAVTEGPGGDDPLRAESELPHLLAELAVRHAGARPVRPIPHADRVARAVRDRLADQIRTPPTLAELAADLGLSRFHLVRAFRDVTGMPPYAWLAQHRVARARALLDAGRRPAEAAAAVGFADQAHLTRWFRRVLGVTPGAYRNSVQDMRRSPG
ncbi:helix-turn-helix transcriptional regulator [Streptomyces radicis]|uniref:AraC family transcriptional regulator n=1 Tax=Streptomyces radicis TaxID=1750517 RepID=A0A3A9X0X8_9ACTN|nr:AraC family transcriptional regulator [Streptomyces radicis]RKN12107.1 AraC family transcriptional regulator [Streptomyces radicis]RKN25840.1 AraC family transcriptional regulator [Streptomyces radicis]